MKSNRTLLLLAAVFAFSTTGIHAADVPKPLDTMIEKAMTAYNAGDSKAFFTDYAKLMESSRRQPHSTRFTKTAR